MSDLREHDEHRNTKKNDLTHLFLTLSAIFLSVIILFLIYSFISKFSTNRKPPPIAKEEVVILPETVQLEVLNGCGVAGMGELFTDYLRNNKYDVIQTDNYYTFSIENTLVIDRIGNMHKAISVAKSLGVDTSMVIQQINKDYFLDVSVIIGKDFYKLEPSKKR